MRRPAPLCLVVFDCDGTLVDSQYVILAAMTAAWATAGRAEPPVLAAVRRVIGLPLVEAIARLVPDGKADEHAALAEAYKAAFRARRVGVDLHEPLFPGAREALDLLEAAGSLLGIATGKGRVGLERTLACHGLAQRFATLQTSDAAPGKPSPEMLFRAMRETGATPAATAMVGDTTFDMAMARNAGVAAIGVSWGYHDARELRTAGAHVVIERFDELSAALADLGVQAA